MDGVVVHPLGEAEVGDLRHAVLGQEDVARLEVAVQDAALMGDVDRPGQSLDQLRGLPGRQGLLADPGRQRAPFDELEREVGISVGLVDLIDLDDVRMPKLADRLGLRLEASEFSPAGVLGRQDHLEGGEPADAAMPGLVDDAHAAAAQDFEDVVVADRRRDRQVGRRRRRFHRRQGRRAERRHVRIGGGAETSESLGSLDGGRICHRASQAEVGKRDTSDALSVYGIIPQRRRSATANVDPSWSELPSLLSNAPCSAFVLDPDP